MLETKQDFAEHFIQTQKYAFFFFGPHLTFSKIDHIIKQKERLKKKTEIKLYLLWPPEIKDGISTAYRFKENEQLSAEWKRVMTEINKLKALKWNENEYIISKVMGHEWIGSKIQPTW